MTPNVSDRRMTSEEVLALAHGPGIFVGNGLEIPGGVGYYSDGKFTWYTLADIQNVLHGATSAYHETSEEFIADTWGIRGSLPGIGDIQLFVEVRDKTLVVRRRRHRSAGSRGGCRRRERVHGSASCAREALVAVHVAELYGQRLLRAEERRNEVALDMLLVPRDGAVGERWVMEQHEDSADLGIDVPESRGPLRTRGVCGRSISSWTSSTLLSRKTSRTGPHGMT